MNQQFQKIELHPSSQEQNCITLENWIDQLTNPDFRQSLIQCKDEKEMIKLFPIVGYGLQIIYKDQKEVDIKVKQISQVEKIIDWATIQLEKQNLTRDKPNCILPLLKKNEQNSELLKSEIFKRKISYVVTRNHQLHNQDMYIILIQSTLRHLIKINNNQLWQQEMIEEIFEVCEQIFIGSDKYYNSIQNEGFKNSTFKLLNVFCLNKQKLIESDEIYNFFVKPQLVGKGCFKLNDEGQNGLGKFFDSLNINQNLIDLDDINGYIQQYLDENDYFYSRLFYGKYLSNLIKYFIPNDKAKQNLRQFFSEREIQIGFNHQQQRELILNFTQSTIYKFLYNRLIDQQSGNKKKLFQSFNQAIQSGNYYSFLQNYRKYEDLVQYYIINTQLSEQQTYQYGINLLIQFTVQYMIKQIPLTQLKKQVYQNWQEVRQSKEVIEKVSKIQKFINIFEIKEELKMNIQDDILDTISELCWLNCQTININYQNDQDIVKYLMMIKDYPQSNNLKQNFSFHQKYLYDVAQFCFKIKNQTQIFKYFEKFEKIELNSILPKDSRKASNFLKIYQISKSLTRS